MATADDDVPIPPTFRRLSNDEYAAPPLSPVVQEATKRALDHAETTARRLNMDRRTFLTSVMGGATFLAALAACSDDERKSRTTTTGRGGTYTVPHAATTEPAAAGHVIGPGEFVFDVQTHLLDIALADQRSDVAAFAKDFPYAKSCGEADWRACFSHDHWYREIFTNSDTALAVISAVPIVTEPNPLSIEVMETAKAVAERVCGNGRVLVHGQVNPNVGELGALPDSMGDLVSQHRIAAWKAYTHMPAGAGWRFDDTGGAPVECGRAFLDAVHDVGPKIVCVHKGFGNGSAWASPADIGPAAKLYPDLKFVVYHSGYETGVTEGPYSPAGAGVDRLVRSLHDAGIAPGSNVYAELGSTWFNVLRSPDEAAHVLGKLLGAVGPDRLLWGTDSIWYGSPQSQIEAFRAFEITAEFQDRFGYPALTKDLKTKILGVNAAALYGVSAPARNCRA